MKDLSSYVIFMVVVSQARLVRLDKFNMHILTQHVDSLMDDRLGFSAMQKHAKLLAYQTKHYEGAKIVEQVAKHLANKISGLVKDMQECQHKLSHFAKDAQLLRNMMENLRPACCPTHSYEEAFYNGNAFKVNLKETCSSTGADLSTSRGISNKVTQLINANFKKHSFLEKQYLAVQNDVFTFSPTEESSCATIRSNFRPKSWFLQALTPKKRHVVVLLDTSYSMSHTHNSKTLLKNAIGAIEHLIHSALPTTKIDVVAFNDSITIFRSCGKFLSFRPEFGKRSSPLKKRLLSDLTAGGQSYFIDAFEMAFQLLSNEASNEITDTRHMTILLISDGGASETFNNKTHEIYQAIANGNKVLNNTVRIFTYGVGRTNVNMDLLREIARQDFHMANGELVEKKEISSGLAFRINEPEMLDSLLQSYSNNLDNYHIVNTPVISQPFFDPDTATVKVTFVVHMYNNHTDFDEILAGDFSMADLMKELRLNDYRPSYFFIIGKDRTVLFHPSMTNLDRVGHDFKIPHIEQLEPYVEVHRAVTQMILGRAGQSTVTLKLGQSDLTTNEQVDYTYYWHPITDTEFTLCFVEERLDHSVYITPEYAISGCLDGKNILPASLCPDAIFAQFQYHKLIEANEDGICDYLKKPSTVKGSVVKFAPRCYKSSSLDMEIVETTATMKSYQTFFNKIFNATSFVSAKFMVDTGRHSKFIRDSLHDGVVSDVLWTAIADNVWKKNTPSCIARRFIATKSGAVRLFPGTRLPSKYDPLKREWYQSATSHYRLTMISKPYEDAAGAGTVITLSRAINKPRFNTKKFNNKVIAVMGLDIHPFCLEASMIRLIPTCINENICGRYILEQIPHTNAFFMAIEHHDTCYYKTCLRDNMNCGLNSECIDTEIWPNSRCECPCSMKIEADPCSHHGQSQWNETMLCATSSGDDILSNYCPAENRDRCFSDTFCTIMDGPLECSQKTGCVWCITSKQGPTCENMQDCFEKSYFNANDEDSCHQTFSTLSLSSTTIIASTTVSGATAAIIFLLVLVYCTGCCQRKESYQFPNSAPDNFRETVTWNQIQNDGNPSLSKNVQGKLSARMDEKQLNVRNFQKMPSLDKNDATTMSSDGNVFVTESPHAYRRENFRQHKASRTINERNVAELKSMKSKPATSGSTTSFPSSQTGIVHKRRRRHDSPMPTIDTSVRKNKSVPAKESNTVAKLLQSVLKKRTDKGSDAQSSNDIYMEEFSGSLDNVPSYFKMFAEPADNEGDIPIIQSDNSDNESLKNVSKL